MNKVKVKTFVKKSPDYRFLTLVLAILALVVLVAITVLAAIYLPQLAIYVPIMSLALALALQKYLASFASYFIITFSRIYDIGDRIRIDNLKGDVRKIGLMHTTLEEVGEDEKLGGELTGRLLHLPNLVILDRPVLNYSKDYSIEDTTISSDYMFDEVRIPVTTDSNIKRATELLEDVLKNKDALYVKEAGHVFQDGYPRFLDEATNGPRVQIHIEPQRIWIKGKFVAPLRARNDLRTQIYLEFINKARECQDIKLS
jgi:small-conductance mechanosensitive channel